MLPLHYNTPILFDIHMWRHTHVTILSWALLYTPPLPSPWVRVSHTIDNVDAYLGWYRTTFKLFEKKSAISRMFWHKFNGIWYLTWKQRFNLSLFHLGPSNAVSFSSWAMLDERRSSESFFRFSDNIDD